MLVCLLIIKLVIFDFSLTKVYRIKVLVFCDDTLTSWNLVTKKIISDHR